MNRTENSLLYESHYQTKIVSGRAVCVYVCVLVCETLTSPGNYL